MAEPKEKLEIFPAGIEIPEVIEALRLRRQFEIKELEKQIENYYHQIRILSYELICLKKGEVK